MDDVDMAGATSAKSPKRPRAGQAVVNAKRAARAERKQTSAVRKTEKNATKAARKKAGVLHRKVLKERKAFQQLFQADEGKALDTLLDGLGGFGLTNLSAPQKTANKKPDAPASQPLQETSLASNSLHDPDKSNEVVNDPGHVGSAKSARKERALNKKQEAIKKAAERRGITVEELQMQKKERRIEKQERKLQRQQKSAEGQAISLEDYNKAQQDSKRKKRQKRQNAKDTRVQQADADKPHSNGASLPNMGIVDFGAPMEL